MWENKEHPRGMLGKKGLVGFKPSAETRKRLSESHIGIKYPTIQGKGHWNWRGGITAANEAFRKSAEYKSWRRDVFERDDYTCVICGKRGRELHADHIIPFWKDIKKRLDITNGRTLCAECHRKTDTYGHNAVKSKAVSS